MEVKEIDAAIDAQRSVIRCARTTLHDDKFYERSRAQLVQQIEALQVHLERLDNERANGRDIIDTAKARITQLQELRKKAQLNGKITKYLELMREINETS